MMTEKIWQNHFKRLEAEKRDPPVSVHPDAEAYVTGGWKKNGEIQDDLQNIKWNGREIRNGKLPGPPSYQYANTVHKQLSKQPLHLHLMPQTVLRKLARS